jgi:hypothetical protein
MHQALDRSSRGAHNRDYGGQAHHTLRCPRLGPQFRVRLSRTYYGTSMVSTLVPILGHYGADISVLLHSGYEGCMQDVAVLHMCGVHIDQSGNGTWPIGNLVKIGYAQVSNFPHNNLNDPTSASTFKPVSN